jgi:hypothetical protein
MCDIVINNQHLNWRTGAGSGDGFGRHDPDDTADP